MTDLSKISDDELMGLLKAAPAQAPATDLSGLSNEDLLKALGQAAPTKASFDERFKGEGGGERRTLEEGLIGKAEELGRPTRTESFLTGAAQGLTANFLDEAASGVNALYDVVTGQAPNGMGAAYERHLASARRQDRDAQETNPGTYLTGQIAGGVATAPALPGGTGVVGGMKAGAAYGAVSGAGAGEGIEGRAVGAGVGALTGGAVGAAVPAAINGVTAVAKSIGNVVSSVAGSARGAINAEAEAARRITAARAADAAVGDVADEATVAAGLANGQPLRVIDTGGEKTRALARASANVSPEGRAILDGTVNPRYEAQADRVTEFIRSMVGTADAGATRETLQQAAKAANRGAYAKAYAQGSQGVWDDTLAQLVQAPAVQAEIRDAARRSANKAAGQGFKPVRNPFVVAEDGTVSLQEGVTPNLQFWDVVKQGLDDQINALQRNGKGGEAGDLIGLRDALRNRLDEIVPSYREARRGAASAFDAEDALEAGQKFVRSNVSINDARRAVARMTEPERKLFAEGFASDLIDQINRVPDRQSVVNRIFGSPQARQRIEVALGKDKASELEAFIRVEHLMELPRKALQGNSTTTRQLVELGLVSAGGGATWMTGDNRGLAMGVVAAALSRGRAKVDARVAQKVAEMLASDDPAVLQQAMKTVSRNPRLMEAIRGAEDYLVRSLGPAVNDNLGQPLTMTVRPMASGARPSAASDSKTEEEPQ